MPATLFDTAGTAAAARDNAPDVTRTQMRHAIGACGACGHGIATIGDVGRTRVVCPHCSAVVELRWVAGYLNGNVPCDARCMGAVGPNCDCSCGGENHGTSFLPADVIATWAPVKQRAAAAGRKHRADAVARTVTKRAEKAAAAAAALATERDAFITENPALAALLGDDYAPGGRYGSDDFVMSLRGRLQAGGYFSERMIAAGTRMIERNAQRDRDAQERDARPAAEPITEPGMYRRDGVIYRVQESRTSAQLYAKRAQVITAAERDGAGNIITPAAVQFDYAPGAVRNLTPADRMGIDDAREFGASHGICIYGHPLTDPLSVAAGIGPVCAEKFGVSREELAAAAGYVLPTRRRAAAPAQKAPVAPAAWLAAIHAEHDAQETAPAAPAAAGFATWGAARAATFATWGDAAAAYA